MTDPIYLLAVLGAIAEIAEWMGRRHSDGLGWPAALWVPELGWTADRGIRVPPILILTTLALLMVHVPAVQRLGGARTRYSSPINRR